METVVAFEGLLAQSNGVEERIDAINASVTKLGEKIDVLAKAVFESCGDIIGREHAEGTTDRTPDEELGPGAAARSGTGALV